MMAGRSLTASPKSNVQSPMSNVQCPMSNVHQNGKEASGWRAAGGAENNLMRGPAFAESYGPAGSGGKWWKAVDPPPRCFRRRLAMAGQVGAASSAFV